MVEKGIGEKQGEEAQNGGLRKPLSREVEESRKAWWGGQQRMAQGYGGVENIVRRARRVCTALLSCPILIFDSLYNLDK